MYNYSKLRGKIREVFHTEAAFAHALKLSKPSLSAKLNNVVGFSQIEMEQACHLLRINPSELGLYFLTRELEP